ncbi:MAG: PP2C family protein-serine/threonine phosphatase, partial [Myxococcota bacterium]
MASVVVFPLMGRGRCIGALVAFDATASLDNIEMVQATTRAGATAVENWEMRQKMLQQRRLQEQMDLAAKAQQRLLPAADPNFRGVRVTHFSLYCDETGGDYVDAFTYEPSGSVGSLIIGDVAGHGLGAAMLMVDLRARLRTMLTLQNPWAPHAVLESASSVLHRDSGTEEFVTLFLATVDARTGVMRYANAGHEHPLLYKAREQRWVELESTGVPLGLIAGSRYEVGVVSIEPGDILVAMTDGVTEAQALSGEAFGTDVVKRAVEALAGETPETIMEAVVAETVAHRDRRAFSDDLTFLIAVVDEVGIEILDEPPILHGELLLETEFSSTAPAKDAALRELEETVRGRFAEAETDALLLSCEEA